MAQEIIKLECIEDGTRHFVTTHRNKKNTKKRSSTTAQAKPQQSGTSSDNKLSLRRYNPILRRHCIYTETSKLK